MPHIVVVKEIRVSATFPDNLAATEENVDRFLESMGYLIDKEPDQAEIVATYVYDDNGNSIYESF